MGDRPKNRPASLFARPRALLVDDRPLRIDLPGPPPLDRAPRAGAPGAPATPPPEEDEAQAGPVRLFIGAPRSVTPARVRAGFDGSDTDAEGEPPPPRHAEPWRAAVDLELGPARGATPPPPAPRVVPPRAVVPAPSRPVRPAVHHLEDTVYEGAAAAPPARLPDRPFVASAPAPRRGDRSFAPRVPPRRPGFSPTVWAVAGLTLVGVGLLGIWVQIRDEVSPDGGAPFPAVVEPSPEPEAEAPAVEAPPVEPPVEPPAAEVAPAEAPVAEAPVAAVEPREPVAAAVATPAVAPTASALPPTPVVSPTAPQPGDPPPGEAPPVQLVGAPATAPSTPVVVRVQPPASTETKPAAIVATGLLRVTSNVAGKLYVNGKFKANIVDEAVLELPAGKYEIRLVPRGGRAMSQRVRVDPGVARGLAFEAR